MEDVQDEWKQMVHALTALPEMHQNSSGFKSMQGARESCTMR